MATVNGPSPSGLAEAVRAAMQTASFQRGEVQLHASAWMRITNALTPATPDAPTVASDAVEALEAMLTQARSTQDAKGQEAVRKARAALFALRSAPQGDDLALREALEEAKRRASLIAIVEQGCGGTMTFQEQARSAMLQAQELTEFIDARLASTGGQG